MSSDWLYEPHPCIAPTAPVRLLLYSCSILELFWWLRRDYVLVPASKYGLTKGAIPSSLFLLFGKGRESRCRMRYHNIYYCSISTATRATAATSTRLATTRLAGSLGVCTCTWFCQKQIRYAYERCTQDLSRTCTAIMDHGVTPLAFLFRGGCVPLTGFRRRRLFTRLSSISTHLFSLRPRNTQGYLVRRSLSSRAIPCRCQCHAMGCLCTSTTRTNAHFI